jgi:hypothetical protein
MSAVVLGGDRFPFSASLDDIEHFLFGKPRAPPIEMELRVVLRAIDRLEVGFARMEDELGLPRSPASDSWDKRLERIHKTPAKSNIPKVARRAHKIAG